MPAYSNPTPAQEAADAARAKARADVAAARELAVCGGGALFVSLAASAPSSSSSLVAGSSSSSASIVIPRPHALAPALAPASSLAALVAAQLAEKREQEQGGEATGNGETLLRTFSAAAENVRLSLNPGGTRDESDDALFGAGSSATIADVAAAVLERKKIKQGGGGLIRDALGPLRVWYSVVGV